MSLKAFGLAFLALAASLSAAFLHLKRTVPAKAASGVEADPVKLAKTRRRLTATLLILPLLLVYGLWATREGPLVPRVVGALVNIIFTAGVALARRQIKKCGG